MSHITQPIKTEGGQKETKTSDDNVQILLLQILKELKKMNMYLADIVGVNIIDEDLGE